MPSVRTSDGTAISYKTMGPGPRNLLFMHGWGNAGTYWDDLLTRIDLSGLRAIVADYRGHGGSDKPKTGYTIERFARDMFEVADDAGAEQLVLVAFSMAGKFAAYMPYLEPDRVLGQMLIAPGPATEMNLGDGILRQWLEMASDRARFRPFLEQFMKVPPREDLVTLYCDTVCSTLPAVLEGTFAMISSESIVEQVSQTRTPTFVIAGLADPILPPDYVRENLVRFIPGARLAALDCGHEIPIELPVETATLLEAFLAGLR